MPGRHQSLLTQTTVESTVAWVCGLADDVICRPWGQIIRMTEVFLEDPCHSHSCWWLGAGSTLFCSDKRMGGIKGNLFPKIVWENSSWKEYWQSTNDCFCTVRRNFYPSLWYHFSYCLLHLFNSHFTKSSGNDPQQIKCKLNFDDLFSYISPIKPFIV